jgi:hypothetical protein
VGTHVVGGLLRSATHAAQWSWNVINVQLLLKQP